MRLPAELIDTAVECGLFSTEPRGSADGALAAHWRTLRQLRRLIDDLGVNEPGAALLVRLRRDVETLQHEVARLRRLEAQYFDGWREARWYDLENS
jgi:hypothetical protein